MKTIIKITKQEAIDAWKEQNKHISMGEDTTVEIEDMSMGTYSFTPTIPPVNQCLVCKQYVGNLTAHICGGPRQLPNAMYTTDTMYPTC